MSYEKETLVKGGVIASAVAASLIFIDTRFNKGAATDAIQSFFAPAESTGDTVVSEEESGSEVI